MPYDSAPSSPLGLTASLHHRLGAGSSGGADARLARRTLAGLDEPDADAFEAQSSLEAEVGYGFSVLGGRAVATPLAGWSRSGESETLRLGQSLSVGASQWRVESEFAEEGRGFRAGYTYRSGDFLDLSVEAARREAGDDDAPGPEQSPRIHAHAARAWRRRPRWQRPPDRRVRCPTRQCRLP